MRRNGLAMFVAAIGLLTGGAMLAPPAHAANFLEKNFWLSGPRYDGQLPPCEAGIDIISSEFAQKESIHWNSDLRIYGFERIREVAFRPWHADTIPRRFCEARATVSDGKVTTVRYSIIEDGGVAGFGIGVEWCVVGYDRNWAYNPACRIARP